MTIFGDGPYYESAVYLAVELGPEHGEDADVLLHGLGQLVGGLLRRGVAQVDAVILQDLNKMCVIF